MKLFSFLFRILKMCKKSISNLLRGKNTILILKINNIRDVFYSIQNEIINK